MRLLLVAAVLTVAGACAPPPIHFMREGPLPVDPPNAAAVNVNPSWKFDTGADYDSTDILLWPASGESRLFAAEPGGRVYALDAGSGEITWQIDSNLDLSAGVGLGEEIVVVASAEGKLLALDPVDGKTLWESDVQAEVLARPLVAAGKVIVRSGSGQVIGLDKDTGTVAWRLRNNVPPLSIRGLASPVQVDDIVVVGFASGRLSGIDIKTGRELWNTLISQPGGTNQIERLIDIDADPIVTGGMLFVAAYQGRVYGVSLNTQKIVWEKPRSTLRNLAAGDDSLLLTQDDGTLVAIELATGKEIWQQNRFKGRGVSNPTVSLSRQYSMVGDYEGYVYVMDMVTGQLRGRGRTRNGAVLATFANPQFDGFYTLSENGTITAWVIDDKA